MSDPERAILSKLIDRLHRLHLSAADDIALMEQLPRDLAEFETMASHRQSATRAVLKSYEQIQDQLARSFRVVPKLMGEATAEWFARDYADFMEKVGILRDAANWSRVVKLRDQLVHDYPLEAQAQFDRLCEVLMLLPFLAETHERLTDFVRTDLPGMTV